MATFMCSDDERRKHKQVEFRSHEPAAARSSSEQLLPKHAFVWWRSSWILPRSLTGRGLFPFLNSGCMSLVRGIKIKAVVIRTRLGPRLRDASLGNSRLERGKESAAGVLRVGARWRVSPTEKRKHTPGRQGPQQNRMRPALRSPRCALEDKLSGQTQAETLYSHASGLYFFPFPLS